MSYILPLIFWLLACVAIGFAMYFKGKIGTSESHPEELNNYVRENARLSAELAGLQKRLGEVSQELQMEKSERDQLSGKGKQLFVEITTLKEKHDSLVKEKERVFCSIKTQTRKVKERKIIGSKDGGSTRKGDKRKRIRKERIPRVRCWMVGYFRRRWTWRRLFWRNALMIKVKDWHIW